MKCKRKCVGLFIVASIVLFSLSVSAVNIGISPGRLNFDDVLREGHAERTVTITTSSEEPLFVSFRPIGEVGDWLSFEPNLTLFNASQGNPYKLTIIVNPPSDVPLGNYSGGVEFVTEGIGGVEGRAGAIVKTALTLSARTEVTGEQIIECRAGAFGFKDVEIGFPFEIGYNVFNDGNTRINPSVTLDIWDRDQKNLLVTREITGEVVLPTTNQRIVKTFNANLAEGQYWVDIAVDQCGAEDIQTFTVVEKGGIVDKGVLRELFNKPWAYTFEPVEFKAKFKNTGTRSVNARFKGAIRLDNKIVKLIETEEILVPSGEDGDFDIFFTPDKVGRYTLSGRVIYNKKLTFEKGTVLNVTPPPDGEEKKSFNWIPLLIYLIIVITIIFIIRKIWKEKKKKKGFGF